MKLWQKVFLFSLLFMIFAVEITTYIILRNNFNMSIERELNQAVYEHDSYSASISGNVMMEKLQSKRIILPVDELLDLLKELLPQKSVVSMAIYFDDKNITSYSAEIIEQKKEFRSNIQEIDTCSTLITDYENKTYIIVGSKMEIDGQDLSLFTTKDISILYENYNKQISFVQLIAIISASILAMLLLIIVLVLLAPLSSINKTIKEISSGNYTLRLKKRGGKEFKELTENVNEMAASVEENTTRLQNLADSRKQFADSLAHEMKTPLTSIVGFADILRVKRKVTENERLEYANAIMNEAKRMKGLSGKLLELAATSNLSLDLETINVKELFDEVNLIFLAINQRNIQIIYNTDNKSEIRADKELFKSLLYNLIDNAIKASQDDQKIKLNCESTEKEVIISVSDSGIGMDEETLRKATEPFYMADKSRSRKAGGVGLGLSLCREIVKRHNAQIKFKSKPGKGTTVSIIIPSEVKK